MIYDEETGEMIKDKFAKLYFKDIEKLFGLTNKQMSLLLLMIKQIGLGNSSSLNMTPKRKKEFAEIIKVTTTNSISNMLRQLDRLNVIKRLEPEEYPNKYIVNPDIIFSGNDYQRVKVMIEYTNGERKVKVFSNEQSLYKYLELKQNKEE